MTEPVPQSQQLRQRLKISEDKHFLMQENGKPFFYLGDTAWELFHRLNRKDADLYLQDRAKKGFTVIQAVVLAPVNGLGVPNPYGHLPLDNKDPTKPNEAYFKHVDYIVDQAEKLGLYIGMLPTWGDKWNKGQGDGPEIFTPENAEVFGEYLGKRYQDKPIIWILGGDRNPENEQHKAIIRAMAKGLKIGDGGTHLMTFHPMANGVTGAEWFKEDDWLDFNMYQSGHFAANLANYKMTQKNYYQTPVRPVIDAEPRYEDHPINWNPKNGWFDDFDVRQATYWSLLSGAAGHTYGDHNVWQMLQPAKHKPLYSARTPWKKAIRHPGARQVGYARRLFESRPFTKLVPDQSLIENAGEGANHIVAIAAADGSFAFAYTPTGKPINFKLDALKRRVIKAYWFNPRNGTARLIRKNMRNGKTQKFIPRSSGRGKDWVLVLDTEDFPVPGQSLP